MTGDKEYYEGGKLRNQASTTKSLMSMVIGIALQKGFLDNLDQTLYEFFADIWDPGFTDSEQKKNITIEQILTMNAGFAGDDASPPGGKTANAIDCIEWVLDAYPLVFTPGQAGMFEYCSDAINLLSGIIANVTGNSTEEFAREYLFEPLQISEDEYYWGNDSKGMDYGGYYFLCSPKVQAKLGILAMNNGSWEGEQIVDLNYMKTATTDQTGYDYGYLWWMNDGPFEGYYAAGFGGQSIYVIPEYNIVVGFTAQDGGPYEQMILDYVLQFVEPDVPDDPMIPGFSLNMVLLTIFCITAVLIIRKKKYSKN